MRSKSAKILLVTVTPVESRAVLEVFEQYTRSKASPRDIGHRVYFRLGTINGAEVYLTRSEMGTAGLGASIQAVSHGIEAIQPSAVIMAGIAFGIDKEKQKIGDILVSKQLRNYELQRVGTRDGAPDIILRGDKAAASPWLLNRMTSAQLAWNGAPLRFGVVLSGEKLIDNLDLREQLRRFEPEAIGGEMEGAGLYAASHQAKVDWILVKAICDWADGFKERGRTRRQRIAALNAARFVLHTLTFVAPEGSDAPPQPAVEQIDAVVARVRRAAEHQVREEVGSIRMLRVARPVPTPDIFVDVHVLERLSKEIIFDDWRQMASGHRRGFDRLGLGCIEQDRVPARKKLDELSKVFILGKPGSGKTTLLKALAMSCLNDAGTHVPVYFQLRVIAPMLAGGADSLYQLSARRFHDWGVDGDLARVLDEGRGLFLFDGLDEVPLDQRAKVRETIQAFSSRYHRNRFLITARTQFARPWFEPFTEVEIADFTAEQAETFIRNWYAIVVGGFAGEQLSDDLAETLEDHRDLAELATSPILLNLLCSVFLDHQGQLPDKRGALYRLGLKDLLKKWDDSQGIRRDDDHHISTEQKEELLSKLALRLFREDEWFPSFDKLVAMVAEELSIDMPRAAAVVRSIEDRHGLLIERSEGYYSFSHLTFQEYFAARQVAWLPAEEAAAQLHTIGVPEILKLALELTETPRALMIAFTQRIDRYLQNDPVLERVLPSVREQAAPVRAPYKAVAIRAFFFALMYGAVSACDERRTGTNDASLYRAVQIAPAIDAEIADALLHAFHLRSEFDNHPVTVFTGVTHGLGAALSLPLESYWLLDDKLRRLYDSLKGIRPEIDTFAQETIDSLRAFRTADDPLVSPHFADWLGACLPYWQQRLEPLLRGYHQVWDGKMPSARQIYCMFLYQYHTNALIKALPSLDPQLRAECESLIY